MMARRPNVNTTPVPCSATLPELHERIQHPGAEAWAACVALGHNPAPEALHALIELANHSDWRFRRAAVEALSAHPLASSATSIIVAALTDPSSYVVRTACDTAAILKLQEAHSSVLSLAASNDTRTREAAVRALSRLWRPSDFPAVFAIFKNDPVSPVRRATAWTLAVNVSDITWKALFETWVKGELPRYRVWACEIASRFGDSSAKSEVAALLRDPNGHVRKAAQRALTAE
jgi:hypothetical protein